MSEISQGEIALAILGISNVIKGTVPRWTLEKMREFDKFPKTIEEEASKAIEGKIPLKSLPREHDYNEIMNRLSQPLSQEDVAKIQSRFPAPFDDLAVEFIVTLQNSWAHLKEIFPVSEYLDFTGPKNMLPTGDKTWQFFNKLLVLNNPRAIFMLISSGAMQRSQAQAVREFFPTLATAIDEVLLKTIPAKVMEAEAAGKKFRIHERTKLGLGNWLGRRTVAYDPAPPAPVNPRDLSKGSSAAGLSLSPSQKVTEGGSVKDG